ncbi:MAG: FG-GAP repeat protein [Planctomycetes bacterium]|nr:FG-GAP repeat protein [Planctomycetota bacterium]
MSFLALKPLACSMTALLTVLSATGRAQVEVRTFFGDAAGDRFGAAVAALGDVDLDGRDDFAVGAPFNDAAGADAGQVKVISGRTHNVLWTLNGGPGALFGTSIAAAGDIDFDGHADLVVGAPSIATLGYVEVISGATGATLRTLVGSYSFELDYDQFGFAVGGGKDVDGDGCPDVIVGAPGAYDIGEAQVFSGATGALLHSKGGTSSSDRFAHAVALIGDVNGDGKSEFMAGGPMPNPGPGFVLCFNGANGSTLWNKSGTPFQSANLGWAIAALGDVDGNGIPDVAVGDRNSTSSGGQGPGLVRVLSGSNGAQIAQFSIASPIGAGMGMSVAALGDIDGDGLTEVAAGAPGASNSPTASSVRIWKFGSSAPLASIAPGDADDRFGFALAAGDANGDGLRDLIIGEPFDDDTGTDAGSVHVVTTVRAPTVYCRAEQNSLGCTPQTTAVGIPSATSSLPFTIAASNLLNQKSGLLFYGFRPQQSAFQGGYSCIKPPTVRTSVQSSGGNVSLADCSGAFAYDFNARIQSGADALLVAGAQVFAQHWSRDPADASTTNLTDAVAFYVQP